MSIGAEGGGLTTVSGTISTETNRIEFIICERELCELSPIQTIESIPLLYSPKSIGIKDIFQVDTFEIAIFVFDHIITYSPHCLSIFFLTNSQINFYGTRTASNSQTHLCRTNLKQFTILYQGPKIWNSLPVSVTRQVFLVLRPKCNTFYSKNYWISQAAHSQLLLLSIHCCKWWPIP